VAPANGVPLSAFTKPTMLLVVTCAVITKGIAKKAIRTKTIFFIGINLFLKHKGR
jgi:hypothetical protein